MKIIKNLLIFGLGFGCAVAWKSGYLDGVTKMGSSLIQKYITKDSNSSSNSGSNSTGGSSSDDSGSDSDSTSNDSSSNSDSNNSSNSGNSSNGVTTYDYKVIRIVVQPDTDGNLTYSKNNKYYDETTVQGTFRMQLDDFKYLDYGYEEVPETEGDALDKLNGRYYIDEGYTIIGYDTNKDGYYDLTHIPAQSSTFVDHYVSVVYHVYVNVAYEEWFNGLAAMPIVSTTESN